MLLLSSTSDLIRVITDAAADIEVHASWVDYLSPSTVTPGRTNTASITTATTTTVVGSPGVNIVRNVKFLSIANNHSTTNCTVTVEHTDNINAVELKQIFLLPNETLTLDANGIWRHYDSNGAEYTATTKYSTRRFVSADVVNATTSFADITGLTALLIANKKYSFTATLFYITNDVTTGARFSHSAPAGSYVVGQITASTPGIAATNISVGIGTVNDTEYSASTTGPGSTRSVAMISGTLEPTLSGTFTLRLASEIAVANGLTVQRGSWLHLWENE